MSELADNALSRDSITRLLGLRLIVHENVAERRAKGHKRTKQPLEREVAQFQPRGSQPAFFNLARRSRMLPVMRRLVATLGPLGPRNVVHGGRSSKRKFPRNITTLPAQLALLECQRNDEMRFSGSMSRALRDCTNTCHGFSNSNVFLSLTSHPILSLIPEQS